MSAEPIVSRTQMPSDDVPRQMLVLLLELLRSNELCDEREIAGAWTAINTCLQGRPSLGATVMELRMFDLAAAHLREISSPADMLTVSRGKTALVNGVFASMDQAIRAFSGCAERPDLRACITLGVFDMCTEAIVAVASAGADGLHDVCHSATYCVLTILLKCSAQPECEAKIRSAAAALAFYLEHDLDMMQQVGTTTGAVAARLCCNVFGRDEHSEFTFTPQHIEMLTVNWSRIVRKIGWRSHTKPNADEIHAAQLCVSDAHKPLLIANAEFISYLVDALLLDPDHPRADMNEELKVWCQQHHCEALAQLAMHDASRDALLRDGSVVPALQSVVESGMSEGARELAAAALTALSDKKLELVTEGQKHVMLSCEALLADMMIFLGALYDVLSHPCNLQLSLTCLTLLLCAPHIGSACRSVECTSSDSADE